MKNAYVWYSQRGFANEGTIYVCQEHKVNDLIEKIENLKSFDMYNSKVKRITRKQAELDKCFLACDSPCDNDLQHRINMAYETTNREYFAD